MLQEQFEKINSDIRTMKKLELGDLLISKRKNC